MGSYARSEVDPIIGLLLMTFMALFSLFYNLFIGLLCPECTQISLQDLFF